MLSNTKFGKFVLCVSLASLVGCSSVKPERPRMPVDNLAYVVPNCNIAQQQLDWLRSQYPTRMERRVARMEWNGLGPFADNWEAKRDVAQGKIEWLIDLNIKDIYAQCLNPKPVYLD